MTADSWRQLEDMQGRAGRIISQARVWSRLHGLLQRLFPELFDAGARLARIRGATVVVMTDRAEHAVLVRYRQGEILQALQAMWPEPLEKLMVRVANTPAGLQAVRPVSQAAVLPQSGLAAERLERIKALLTQHDGG